MIVNWIEYEGKNHVVAHVLLEAMSAAGIDQFRPFNPEQLDVVLTVNGIEVPLVQVLQLIQDDLAVIQENAEVMARETHLNGMIELRASLVQTLTNLDDLIGDE